MPSLANTNSLTEGERAFLQYRVARFGHIAGLIFLSFWAIRALILLLGPEGGTAWATSIRDSSLHWHLAASLCLLAVWGVASRGKLSARAIRWVESIGLILAGGGINMMALNLPLVARADFILVLAIGSALTVRAIYVPSTWQRSLVLAAVLGVDAMVTVYIMWLEIDVVAWSHVQPALIDYSPQVAAATITGNAALWWIVTMITTSAASYVTYGLRGDVRKAKQLGQYHLEEKLGEGGMGIVFKANHALLRRPTAVKLLLPEKAGERSIQRFEREVRLMARLRHPNTVTIFDYGRSPDGVFYYAMELIEGATLADVVEATGPMDMGRAVQVVEHACAAMVEAHGIGLIHRDIKPANIMLHLPHRHGGIEESAKVLDFGLVKEISGVGDQEITQAGSITGTPQYMSPESIRSPENVDERSDVYALGCVLFYLLTGEHVFDGGTLMEVCASHLHEAPDRISDRTREPVPEALEAIVADCLVKDPDQRLRSARELQQRLATLELQPFTAHDALDWWEEYGETLIHAGSPAEQMLTVDLARARNTPTP